MKIERSKIKYLGAMLVCSLSCIAAGNRAFAALAVVDADSDGLIDINSLDDLNEMRDDLHGASLRGSTIGCPTDTGCFGYELTRDLDFDSNSNGVIDSKDWNGGKSWIPVGGPAAPFSARFEGNGHVIRHLNIAFNQGNVSYGLFGSVADDGKGTVSPSISNVGLLYPALSVSVPQVDRRYYVGMLAGDITNTSIDSCYVSSGTLISSGEMTVNATLYVGGLFGYANGSSITHSSFDGTVDASQATFVDNIGGLVGKVESFSTITRSYSKGTLTGGQSVGGLVDELKDSSVYSSFADVQIRATGNNKGTAGGTL